jgi:FkbM family methyltransferase
MAKPHRRKFLALSSLKAVCPPAVLMKFRAAYLTREVLRKKARREHAMGVLHSLVESGDSVADLGANIGIYALELSELVGRSGSVHSVEPIAANFQILADVVRKRDLSNVRLYRAAIGSRAGTQEMIVPDGNGFIGFYSAHFARDGEKGTKETVEVVTLDDLWKKSGSNRLDFVKADVAGAELEMIAGARGVLESFRPGLLVGVSRRTGDQALNALRDLGYSAFLYGDHLVETPKYLAASSYHYFFLHTESKCWDRAVSAGLLR